MTDGQYREACVGIAERKEREKAERRSLILSTTRDLILEKGLATVTMVDIAKKCELSKAALYLYFPSKEAILSELFYASANYFLSYVSSKITEEDTGIMAIRKLWMSYIEIFGESSDIIVLFGATNIISPEYPYVIDESPEGQKKEPFRLFKLIEEISYARSKGRHSGFFHKPRSCCPYHHHDNWRYCRKCGSSSHRAAKRENYSFRNENNL